MKNIQIQFLLPGQCAVYRQQNLQVETILGSCVSVTLHDRGKKMGGICHAMLPAAGGESNPERLMCYLDRALEYLLRTLYGSGCRIPELEAKLFGGGRVLSAGLESFYDVAGENVRAARQWLQQHGLIPRESNTGGVLPRKLRFVPSTGHTECTHPNVMPGQLL
ncbi:MAG: chemotaxis protein CheD [Spirochaetales bacterium]|nr:chemotaxis protein CheD [Spirochaetales bacterium]